MRWFNRETGLLICPPHLVFGVGVKTLRGPTRIDQGLLRTESEHQRAARFTNPRDLAQSRLEVRPEIQRMHTANTIETGIIERQRFDTAGFQTDAIGDTKLSCSREYPVAHLAGNFDTIDASGLEFLRNAQQQCTAAKTDLEYSRVASIAQRIVHEIIDAPVGAIEIRTENQPPEQALGPGGLTCD